MTDGTGHLPDDTALQTELVDNIHNEYEMKPTHIYHTRSGVALQLRPISPILLRRMEKDSFGKPQPPVVETRVGPQKHRIKEANPDDPDYKAALALWEEDHNENMLIYLFSRGICDDPNPDEVERLKSFLPGSSPAGIKYAWVVEMLQDDTEIAELTAIIMGQSVPTAKGIGEAEARFPGNSERESD